MIVNSGCALDAAQFYNAVKKLKDEENKAFVSEWEKAQSGRLASTARLLHHNGVALPYNNSGSSLMDIVAAFVGMDVAAPRNVVAPAAVVAAQSL